MKTFFLNIFFVFTVGTLAAWANGTSSGTAPSVDTGSVAPSPPTPTKEASARKAKTGNRKASAPSKREPRLATESKFLFDEAKNLLVANQKYLVKYEDEDNYGRLATNGNTALSMQFSPDEVDKFRDAVQKIADYRTQMRQRCLGSSVHYVLEALDQYLVSLCSFNRRALPLVADISENNNTLILLVNRAPLVDAPVLISRYLQFKKQRFKESMNKFLPLDNQLIASMVTIANILKVEISDEEWNKSYGVRDSALELVSLWPREPIFEATERLSDIKEPVCVVEPPGERMKQAREQASAPKIRTGE